MCLEYFDYCFNFTSSYWYIQAFCSFLTQFWSTMFLEICPFHPGFHISWHLVVHSNFLQFVFVFLCISVVSVVISPLLFLILFIWVLSIFSLMSLIKGVDFVYLFKEPVPGFINPLNCSFSVYVIYFSSDLDYVLPSIHSGLCLLLFLQFLYM